MSLAKYSNDFSESNEENKSAAKILKQQSIDVENLDTMFNNLEKNDKKKDLVEKTSYL